MRVFQMCVDGIYPVENLRWVSPAYHFLGKKKGLFFRLTFIDLSLQNPLNVIKKSDGKL
jgi:hypothetical protein